MNKLSVLTIAATALLFSKISYAEAEKASRNIYDESAVGTEQIAEALQIAQKENKRVILQFGANWCVWCHRLHNLYQSDADVKTELDENFVVVLVDVNKGNNADVNEKYGNPTKLGLPVIVILDKDGTQLTTQNTGDLESGAGHDPQKVLAFLESWEPVH